MEGYLEYNCAMTPQERRFDDKSTGRMYRGLIYDAGGPSAVIQINSMFEVVSSTAFFFFFWIGFLFPIEFTVEL